MDSPEIINLSSNDSLKSSNFGPGIELLMNDKTKNSGPKNYNIDLEDISALEAELNDVSSSIENINLTSEIEEPIKINFDSPSRNESSGNMHDNIGVSFDEPTIGHATANDYQDHKTWDGYGKFNDIPIAPEKEMTSSRPELSKEETLKEKFRYLKKLEDLERKGAELSKKYSMDSSLDEMMGEYEILMSERERVNSVKFQGNMLSAAINGIEFLNNRFDPFDVKLDGWGEQFSENINDYDEIFAELHEKYKSKAKMAPELKLLFQLAGGAMMVHMTNTMFKSAMPNMDDILRQNPELMQQFNSAAVNSMGSTNPGFSGFMNNVMSQEPGPNVGPPPEPIATQGPNSMQPPRRPGFVDKKAFSSNRPDLDASRSGTNLDDNYGNPNAPERSSIRRAEMKGPSMSGPSDISNILSNLKTKTVNMDLPQNTSNIPEPTNMSNDVIVEDVTDINETGSTISISELKSLQSDGLNGKAPKKSKRRNTSNKNTVSLDI